MTPQSTYKWTSGNVAVDLHVSWDRWTDPGDYPSNMGAGPLPPGPWMPEEITGTVRIILTDQDREEIKNYGSVGEWVNDGMIGEIVEDVKIHWSVVFADDKQVIVEPEKFEVV